MFLNGEQRPLESAIDVDEKVRAIARRIEALTIEWERCPDDVDLISQLAVLWREHFKWGKDEASLDGAEYYYHYAIRLHNGSDPSLVRKLREVRVERLDLYIARLEAWLSEWDERNCEDVAGTRLQLASAKQAMGELLAEKEMEEKLFGGNGPVSRVQFW